VVAGRDAFGPAELDSLIQAKYSVLVVGGGEKFLYLHIPNADLLPALKGDGSC